MKSELQQSYDVVASAFAKQFLDELAPKPFDRKKLDWLAEKTDGQGTICDMGCGPGQIAGYLQECGANVCGIDLSEEMVRQATAFHPEIKFAQGNMLHLDGIDANTFTGIAAFYSITGDLSEVLCLARSCYLNKWNTAWSLLGYCVNHFQARQKGSE